jgi:hypothetical protein
MAQVTIGSFGIRLSGGQRARVALARAAYMEVERSGTGRPWKAVEGHDVLLWYDYCLEGHVWKAILWL